MKVLLINGSPKKEGCTYTALKEVADELERNGVETEIFHIGTAPVKGCMGCGYCAKTGNHQCVYNDDTLNEAILKAKPSTLKGQYLRSVTIAPTMGPGVKLNPVKLV